MSDDEALALLTELLTTSELPWPHASEVLASLLATPLPSAVGDRPIRSPMLHSVAAPRPARRVDLDRILLRGAQLSGVVSLIFCSYWFTSVPLRNWIQAATSEPSVRPQTVQLTTGIAGTNQLIPTPALHVATITLQPTITPLPTRDPITSSPTWLTIPAIGVDTRVINTFFVNGEWQAADYAAGYLYGTGIPGEVGNAVISGHLGFTGGVFARLGELNPGDVVYVDRPGWRFTYIVSGQQVVWPTQLEVILPENIPVLTLITCTNWDTQRLIVVADLVGSESLSQ